MVSLVQFPDLAQDILVVLVDGCDDIEEGIFVGGKVLANLEFGLNGFLEWLKNFCENDLHNPIFFARRNTQINGGALYWFAKTFGDNAFLTHNRLRAPICCHLYSLADVN